MFKWFWTIFSLGAPEIIDRTNFTEFGGEDINSGPHSKGMTWSSARLVSERIDKI